jgi:glycosyltransferase involved in cell wall biosynthesis
MSVFWTKMITASVIITTKDKTSRLKLVLQALSRQVTGEIEVIVVMDGCAVSAVRELEGEQFDFSPLIIVCQQNRGRSAARNVGLNLAKGKILIFLDDDRVPAPDFVRRHIAGHTIRCALIGGRREILFSENEIITLDRNRRVLDDFDNLFRGSRCEYGDRVSKRKYLWYAHNPLRWLGFSTGNVSLEKRDIEAVGAFDENFRGWGYEDTELGYRLCKARIPFRRDPAIVNYHLLHQVDLRRRFREEAANLKYFINSVGRDGSARLILWSSFFQLCVRYAYHRIAGLGARSLRREGRPGR